jgi:hypothetical protein
MTTATATEEILPLLRHSLALTALASGGVYSHKESMKVLVDNIQEIAAAGIKRLRAKGDQGFQLYFRRLPSGTHQYSIPVSHTVTLTNPMEYLPACTPITLSPPADAFFADQLPSAFVTGDLISAMDVSAANILDILFIGRGIPLAGVAPSDILEQFSLNPRLIIYAATADPRSMVSTISLPTLHTLYFHLASFTSLPRIRFSVPPNHPFHFAIYTLNPFMSETPSHCYLFNATLNSLPYGLNWTCFDMQLAALVGSALTGSVPFLTTDLRLATSRFGLAPASPFYTKAFASAKKFMPTVYAVMQGHSDALAFGQLGKPAQGEAIKAFHRLLQTREPPAPIALAAPQEHQSPDGLKEFFAALSVRIMHCMAWQGHIFPCSAIDHPLLSIVHTHFTVTYTQYIPMPSYPFSIAQPVGAPQEDMLVDPPVDLPAPPPGQAAGAAAQPVPVPQPAQPVPAAAPLVPEPALPVPAAAQPEHAPPAQDVAPLRAAAPGTFAQAVQVQISKFLLFCANNRHTETYTHALPPNIGFANQYFPSLLHCLMDSALLQQSPSGCLVATIANCQMMIHPQDAATPVRLDGQPAPPGRVAPLDNAGQKLKKARIAATQTPGTNLQVCVPHTLPAKRLTTTSSESLLPPSPSLITLGWGKWVLWNTASQRNLLQIAAGMVLRQGQPSRI